jgi:hypothetical protein
MPVDPRNIEVIDDEMAAVFRAMTGAQRLKIASDMFSSARRMIGTSSASNRRPPGDSRMEQSELLRYLTKALERIGLRYFVTGSTATVFFGEPRFTNDIDVVVDLPANKIPELCAAFPSPEFYLSEETVRRAVSRRGQFNIIQPSSGL